MGKNKKSKEATPSVKKQFREKITFQLSTSLAELKGLIGEKKFNARIEKASRLFSSGIRKKDVLNSHGVKQITARKKVAEETALVKES
jgi:hypothetical protein